MNLLIAMALFPVVGLLIGAGTNYLAVRMLFRPFEPLNLLGFKLQGLVPKRRHPMAVSIGETIQENLFSTDDISQILQHADLEQEVAVVADNIFDEQFKTRLSKYDPMLALVPDGMIDKFKTAVTGGMLQNSHVVVKGLIGEIESNVNFKQMAIEKIDSFDLRTLERIILRIASAELRHIVWLGGILGFIIGVFQVGLFTVLR